MSRQRRLWFERDPHDEVEGGPFSHARWNPPADEAPTEVADGDQATRAKRRRRGPGLAGLALLVSLIALLGTVAALVFGGIGGSDTAAPAPLVSKKDTGLPRTDVGKVYANAGDGVVSVQSRQRAGTATGTGFVIAGDGTIVTNAHVVEGAQEAQVRFGDSDRQVSAKVVGTDTSTDLAVLKVESRDAVGVRPLTLANSDEVQVGDEAIAIGHPFGLDRTATAGIISGVKREIQAPNGFQIEDAIQTDAPINPGNSGGPLLDAKGRVIGVNSQIATSGGSNGNVGIGFAVPANTIRTVIPRLQKGQRVAHAYLGVSTSDSPGHDGATVQVVPSGGPASGSGIEVGDKIVEVDGKSVSAPDDVATAIGARKPGDQVTVKVERGGITRSMTVTLGDRPDKAP